MAKNNRTSADIVTTPLAFVLLAFISMAFIFLMVALEYITLAVVAGIVALVAAAGIVLSSGTFSLNIERKTIMHNQSTAGRHHQPQQQIASQQTALIEQTTDVIEGEIVEIKPAPVHPLTHQATKPSFAAFRRDREKSYARQ